MRLDARLKTLEDALSPKELVILWMREAHEHGNFVSYGKRLLDQPDDAYPLIRLPQHLFNASPLSKSRVCDERDRAALRSSYRDLLFLFHLHSQLNERAIRMMDGLEYRCLYLKEHLLRLMKVKEPKSPQADSTGTKRTTRKRLGSKPAGLEEWRVVRDEVREQVTALLGSATLLSRRYFSGEDLLYPDARERLLGVLEICSCLIRIDRLTFGDEEEQLLVLYEKEHPDFAVEETCVEQQPSAQAFEVARELVILARSEALTMLGEKERGVRIVEEWMRERIWS